MAFKEYVEFYNGQKMPIIGLGTWQSEPAEIKRAVNAALEAGYRHFDTAYNYLNEPAIGEVLQEWIESGKIKREELFIVTKLPMIGNRASDVEKFMKLSLKQLRLEYVDLYLIHFPCGLLPGKDDNDVFPMKDGKLVMDMSTDIIRLWKAMEAQVDAGRTKSIGLSNFGIKQIERIMQAARIAPANLQVEMHAYFQQKPLREACKKHNITICAYAPLGSPGRGSFYAKIGRPAPNIPDILNHPVIVEIAKKHNKAPAHILLRFLTQQNIAVIPKSSNPDRIASNFQIFDFALDGVDMQRLTALDQGEAGRSFDMRAMGVEIHPEYPLKH